MNKILFLVLTFLIISCNEKTLPKPKGYLQLNYPPKKYEELKVTRPYSFEISKNSVINDLPKNWLKIRYPKLKASIDITYRPINGNLKELLMEAEKLVFEHSIKADQISSNSYENLKNSVYGKLFQISGNAASQVQFHVTDSTKHFLKGSLFFYSKPNYDSILPAVDYLKKDMVRIMETLKWKNNK